MVGRPMYDPDLDAGVGSKKVARPRPREHAYRTSLLATVLSLLATGFLVNSCMHIDIDNRTRFAVVTWDWCAVIFAIPGLGCSFAACCVAWKPIRSDDRWRALRPAEVCRSVLHSLAFGLGAGSAALFFLYLLSAAET